MKAFPDQHREAMEGARKTSGAAWPQHFDGIARQNQVALRNGVRANPSAWLFAKKDGGARRSLKAKNSLPRSRNSSANER